jgi:predicted transcriptional regulator
VDADDVGNLSCRRDIDGESSDGSPQNDEELAKGLKDNREHDLGEFVRRYNRQLQKNGYEVMSAELEDSYPPGCTQPFDELTPYVGNRVGTGFIKYHPGSKSGLGKHVARLSLQDLFLVAAGLKHDTSACHHLHDMSTEIATRVSKRFDGPCRDTVQDDGPGHLWELSKETMLDADGRSKRLPRIATYLGMSRLSSWIYVTLFRLGLDCVRRGDNHPPTGPPVDEDGEVGHIEADAPYQLTTDDLQFAQQQYERINSALHQAIDEMQKDAIRRYRVAYLWLYCRFAKSEVAEILTITRAAVSDHVRAIQNRIREAITAIAEDIAEDIAGRLEELPLGNHGQVGRSQYSTERIAALLTAIVEKDPGYFFEPVLFRFVLDAYRTLRDERPDLLRVAWLRWMKDVPERQLAGRICESPERTGFLLLELHDWHDAVTQTAADMLGKRCDMAANTLFGWIHPKISKWLGNVGQGDRSVDQRPATEGDDDER